MFQQLLHDLPVPVALLHCIIIGPSSSVPLLSLYLLIVLHAASAIAGINQDLLSGWQTLHVHLPNGKWQLMASSQPPPMQNHLPQQQQAWVNVQFIKYHFLPFFCQRFTGTGTIERNSVISAPATNAFGPAPVDDGDLIAALLCTSSLPVTVLRITVFVQMHSVIRAIKCNDKNTFFYRCQ